MCIYIYICIFLLLKQLCAAPRGNTQHGTHAEDTNSAHRTQHPNTQHTAATHKQRTQNTATQRHKAATHTRTAHTEHSTQRHRATQTAHTEHGDTDTQTALRPLRILSGRKEYHWISQTFPLKPFLRLVLAHRPRCDHLQDRLRRHRRLLPLMYDALFTT